MIGIVNKFEQLLRIDRFSKSSDLVRVRAMYISVTAFIVTQLVNLAQMLSVYGAWTIDATIAVGAMTFLAALLLSFRFHRRFYIAALGVTGLMVCAICLSSIGDNTGINSALLPFLPVCILLSGFVSGWRMAVFTGAASLGVIVALYVNSVSAINGVFFDPDVFATRNFQRAIQISLACIMTTIITASLSVAMHGLFARDEQSLERVKTAERQRTAFLSSLSHEIRTPLNGIMGMSGLLMKTELTEQQTQYAQIVSDCSQNLMEVMGNVMEYSQIDTARLDLKSESVNFHELSEKLINKHASKNQSNADMFLGMHIAPEVPASLMADKKRVEMVISHLLNNAIEFTPKGAVNLLINGAVHEETQFKLCVYVRDTGVGIRDEDLKSIYRPFHQLDNTLSRRHEGTGLGLSLCKEIIELMGGKLDVVSEVDVGSTFFFELLLPIGEPAKAASKPNQELQGKRPELKLVGF